MDERTIGMKLRALGSFSMPGRPINFFAYRLPDANLIHIAFQKCCQYDARLAGNRCAYITRSRNEKKREVDIPSRSMIR